MNAVVGRVYGGRADLNSEGRALPDGTALTPIPDLIRPTCVPIAPDHPLVADVESVHLRAGDKVDVSLESGVKRFVVADLTPAQVAADRLLDVALASEKAMYSLFREHFGMNANPYDYADDHELAADVVRLREFLDPIRPPPAPPTLGEAIEALRDIGTPEVSTRRARPYVRRLRRPSRRGQCQPGRLRRVCADRPRLTGGMLRAGLSL